jgi:hypothetical protein
MINAKGHMKVKAKHYVLFGLRMGCYEQSNEPTGFNEMANFFTHCATDYEEPGQLSLYSYGLDDRSSISGRGNIFYLLYSVHIASGAHSVSQPIDSGGSFPGVKRQRR